MSVQRCVYCRGELEERRVTRLQEYDGRWFIIENVPALVCKQCGEQFFTPQAHDLVVTLIAGKGTPVRTETVMVFDASVT
jgi:YgiT-type zinc finger domain-containing protein